MMLNIPNILTMARIILIVPFVFAMQYVENPTCILIALIIFSVASFTDLLDGKIARKYNLVTNFGKLMDPLADKLLVMSAMLGFVENRWAPAWVVIVILSREFLVTSVRLIAASEGVVIPADIWGKVKTAVQMVWIVATLLWMYLENSGVLFGVVDDVFV
ncbi:MAG: CDP-diacylglycerol--glycerol-3-phosphate 3-phosphatidyltransferase, partial [Oscillospiraceae bacterium]